MKRTLLLSSALAAVVLAAWFHEASYTPAVPDASAWRWDGVSEVLYANPPVSADDSISDAQALREVERLYRLQARYVSAQSRGRTTRARHVLDDAMLRLHDLVQRPGLTDRPRFRRVYHAFTSEYRDHYGVPDTLNLPQGKIYDIRRGLFSKLNDRTTPQLDEVLPSDIRLTDTEVPMTLNRHVKESMAFLLRNKQRHLYPWLRRSSTYFPMIEHILAEENAPDELKYLTLVESGLNPYAHSHAQAAGIWQFVAPTGRRYGLTVDPWVDERRDPEKATRAAARHLRDLRRMFGDWHLALAGYNCSPSVVRRAIEREKQRGTPTPTFWDIYEDLPEETRNYVPLFIATSVIVSNPAAFDLDRVAPGPRYAFDHVPLQPSLSLEQVARLAEVDVQKVRALNPELRADRIPPSEEPYYVRLPYDTYETFAENYTQMPEEKRTAVFQHAVRSGETVGSIAKRYHVSRPSLLEANDLHPATVSVGQRLKVPQVRYLGNGEVVAEADARPIRVRYGSRATRPIAETASAAGLTASWSQSSAPADRRQP
jgi:membrane-bound lytic murein transglycosylase D